MVQMCETGQQNAPSRSRLRLTHSATPIRAATVRERSPGERVFSRKAPPRAFAGQFELLQYFVQRDLNPRQQIAVDRLGLPCGRESRATIYPGVPQFRVDHPHLGGAIDRKSTRLNSSHLGISYA